MPFRSYLNIPFPAKETAKALCISHGFPLVTWDDKRNQWYFPGQNVPQVLLSRYALIQTVEVKEERYEPFIARQPAIVVAPTPAPAQLTPEQADVVGTEPSGPENALGIIAFAGTGKTHTLRAYARSRPDKRFLYVAFGSANAKSAAASFPKNTTCSTLHALARRWLIASWGDELVQRKIAKEFKAVHVCEALHLEPTKTNLAIAVVVLSALEHYLTSADISISRHHLGPSADALGGSTWSMGDTIQTIIGYAERLWARMKNPKDNLGITHDGYLKLYALSRPIWSYDYVLLDEAQDTNPVTEDLVFLQPCKKIMVGDPHQNIFAFRRSRDVLTRRRRPETPYRYLTTSFRFGAEIAAAANLVLGIFKEEKHPLKGRGKPAKIWGPGTSCEWNLSDTGQYQRFTLLSRTNGALFDEAVRIVGMIEIYEQQTKKKGPQIAFVGTTPMERYSPFNPYKFGRLLDIASLAKGAHDKIVDPFVKKFSTLKELRELVTAEATFDADLSSAISLFDRYRGRLPILVFKICERCADPANSNVWVTFTTAHKSKGLEWQNVRLADDFVPLVIGQRRDALNLGLKDDVGVQYPRLTNLKEFAADEYNLLYVAVTRAMDNLEIPEGFVELLLSLRKTDMVFNWKRYMELQFEPKAEDKRLDWLQIKAKPKTTS